LGDYAQERRLGIENENENEERERVYAARRANIGWKRAWFIGEILSS
jgi:hypothetical protein